MEKDSDDELEYQPVPGSPGANATAADNGVDDDEEEDPLDAFMAGVDKQVSELPNYFYFLHFAFRRIIDNLS